MLKNGTGKAEREDNIFIALTFTVDETSRSVDLNRIFD